MTPTYIERLIGQLPAVVKHFITQHTFLTFFLKTLVIIILFLGVELSVAKISRLPIASYYETSLIFELLQHIGLFPLILLFLLAVFLTKYGNLLSPWQTLDNGQSIRYFVGFLCVFMAWPMATYGYNFYFNQGHYIDRAFIAILLLLVWWRPVFIFPFVILLFTVLWQFKHPNIGGTILAHKLQVLHVLNLFAATFIVHAVTGYRKTEGFIFVTCCLVASAYWLPAFSKLQLDWLSHGHLYRLPIAAYAHGWLSFLSPEKLVSFAQSIVWLDWPMRISVIIIEAGCLLFMLRRSVSISLLIGVIIFHCGVFVLYGFLFWTWMLLDLALLLILLKDYKSNNWNIYNREYLIVSVILIYFCSYWAKPPALGWLDTRLTYTYKLDAVLENGNKFQIPPEFFAPYEDVFTMASFSYLTKDHGILVGPYGVTRNIDMAKKLMSPVSSEMVFELEKGQSQRGHNPNRANRFYEFVRTFVQNHNKNATNVTDLRWLAPARQFWSFEGNIDNIKMENITHVIITEVTTLYDDQSLKVIRQQELMKLKIPE